MNLTAEQAERLMYEASNEAEAEAMLNQFDKENMEQEEHRLANLSINDLCNNNNNISSDEVQQILQITKADLKSGLSFKQSMEATFNERMNITEFDEEPVKIPHQKTTESITSKRIEASHQTSNKHKVEHLTFTQGRR